MPERRKKYSAEFREQAVRRVIDTSRPVATVARELGIVEGTLGSWVHAYRRDHAGKDIEPPLPVSERARLKELERENRELKMQTQFLKKQRRTSLRITGKLDVRVHRRGEVRLPPAADVQVDRCVEIRVLQLAKEAQIGDERTSR